MTELKLFVASLLTKRKAILMLSRSSQSPPAVSGILAALLLVSESAETARKELDQRRGRRSLISSKVLMAVRSPFSSLRLFVL